MCCNTTHREQRCGCGCDSGFRSYPSPEEKIEELEKYKEALKKEQAGVEARIKELQGK